MTARVHIAGFPIRVGRVGRQLCGWCGALLFDEDTARDAVVGGERARPWAIGQLVEVRHPAPGVTAFAAVAHEDGASLPDACCAPTAPPPQPRPYAV